MRRFLLAMRVLLLTALTALGITNAAMAAAPAAEPAAGSAADSAQWGGTSERNNAPVTGKLPESWNVGKFDPRTGEWKNEEAENIRWVAKLGSESYGSPVIAGSKAFCATNNGAGYVKRYPADVDLGCLLAFNVADGSFLWQHSA
ncbi:MAG: hypothetical protein ACYC6Y_12745 [Thermoguttaceae bacterium]